VFEVAFVIVDVRDMVLLYKLVFVVLNEFKLFKNVLLLLLIFSFIFKRLETVDICFSFLTLFFWVNLGLFNFLSILIFFCC